jgi:hypothetical protein
MSTTKIPSSGLSYFVGSPLTAITMAHGLNEWTFRFENGSSIKMPIPEWYTIKHTKIAEVAPSAQVNADGSVSWNNLPEAEAAQWRKFASGGTPPNPKAAQWRKFAPADVVAKEPRDEPFPGDVWANLTGDAYTIVNVGRMQSNGERTVTYRRTSPTPLDDGNWTATMEYFMARVYTVDNRGWATDKRAYRFTRVFP